MIQTQDFELVNHYLQAAQLFHQVFAFVFRLLSPLLFSGQLLVRCVDFTLPFVHSCSEGHPENGGKGHVSKHSGQRSGA